MRIFSGKSVFEGIAIGKIYLFDSPDREIQQRYAEDAAAECERFAAAVALAQKQLEALYQTALSRTGEEQARIFEVHKMMLEDEDYLEAVRTGIEERSESAAYAVSEAGQRFAALFAQMEDAYMKARAADVLDVSQRLIRILSGKGEGSIESDEPVILLAEDLTPSQTVQLDPKKILAFVTRKGSANSHTAILARSMGIPALVGAEVPVTDGAGQAAQTPAPSLHGRLAIVDGFSGSLILDPDRETLQKLEQRQAEADREKKQLQALIGQETVTQDGRKIQLYANIGAPAEAEAALAADAEGIGLFRTEFLYLGREDFPGEEEQFTVYKEVLSRMGGKKVIFRTLDIGADKQASYFELPKEENPAMGFRAIRICLERPEIFRTQLRALLRASVFGRAAIMFPMIVSAAEVVRIREILAAVREELEQENIPFSEVELGIMVETPGAALISDELAGMVDFFSIGTNDLTQYTLAIDRQNQSLEPFYDAHHPAVLRLIRMTVENGHKAGIWVGICGELAADTGLTKTFLDMGVDELSVSPASVLEVRRAVREI